MIRKIKALIKKTLLSNNLTRYLFGLVRTLRHRELLNLSYEEYLNEEYQKVAMDSGNTMYVYQSDKKSQMYVDGTAYNDILNFVWLDGVKEVDAVFDLGANYGQFVLHAISREMAENIETIVAFEPNPKIAKAFRQAIQDSGLEGKVHLVEKGVSNEAGRFSFFINLYSSGGSSINPDNAFNPGDGIFRKEIEIETVTLKDFIDSQNISVQGKKVAIKIDVEGHDFYAFEGSIKLLNDASEFLLIMETTKSAAKEFLKSSSGTDMLDIFEKNSFYVTYKNTMFEVRDYDEYLTHFDHAPGCIDIILSSKPLDPNHYTQVAQDRSGG